MIQAPYTRFIHSNVWFMRLIQWRTRSKWGHVEHILRDGSCIRAWFPGGVQHLPKGQQTAAASELRCTVALTDAQQDQLEAFLLAQVGKPYDWFALFGLAIGQNWSTKGKWICSKLEDAAYKAAGVDLVPGLPLPYVEPGNLASRGSWSYREQVYGVLSGAR